MKFLFILTIIFSFSYYSKAQMIFQKTIGGFEDDHGYSVIQTSDSGFVIAGSTFSSGAGAFDVYLLKIDANGNSSWRKTYGGSDYDAGTSVIQTSDGGFVIAGYTASFGAGDFDIYLIKTDAVGDTLWTRTFGGDNREFGYSVQQTLDGGYVVVGSTLSFGFGTQAEYLIKTDANGNLISQIAYFGLDDENAYSVKQTSDSGYIILGSKRYQGQTDVYLIKTNVSGDTLWTRTLGGPGNDEGRSIQITSDGGYIITGYSGFGITDFDLYLIKIDLYGNLLWSKTYGSTSDDAGMDVQQILNGGYIITGYSSIPGTNKPDVYLIATDYSGDLLWTKKFGGDDFDLGSSVQKTFDGGFIVTGSTKSLGLGDYDVYLIKTDEFGSSLCNERYMTTNVISPPTQAKWSPQHVVIPNIIVNNPMTLVGMGGIDSLLCSSIGINEAIITNTLLLSPNPTTNSFSIQTASSLQNAQLEIFNLLGEKIFSAVTCQLLTVDCQLFPAGIYFVTLQTDKGTSVQKLIKQ